MCGNNNNNNNNNNNKSSCNPMKTREFHLTQMPSTLARQLEIDRSLFRSATSGKVTNYTYRVLSVSAQRHRGRPKPT